MNKHLPLITVTLSLALFLSACGPAGPSTTIKVSLTDFQFIPNSFTVPAGQEITVEAVNTGAVLHDFVIMKHGTTAGNKYDDEDKPNIYWLVELQPGEQTTASFIAPDAPGEYQVICGVKGHYEAGMIGKLIVVAQE